MKTNLKKCPFTKKERQILHFVKDYRNSAVSRPVVVLQHNTIHGFDCFSYHTISDAKYLCANLPYLLNDVIESNIYTLF